jgi:predicted hotdog family 3-hydroxylacyl-ACP dehydratase
VSAALDDHRLVVGVAEQIGVPRAAVADGKGSFVLHAPLELMARGVAARSAELPRRRARRARRANAQGVQPGSRPVSAINRSTGDASSGGVIGGPKAGARLASAPGSEIGPMNSRQPSTMS